MYISGTKEWAVSNCNILTGCEHACLYCYARAQALRFHRIANAEEWANPRLRDHEVRKRRCCADGTIMFPTTHDITPEYLDPCLEVLDNLLRVGNRVLIVSKPHLRCIEAICDRFACYRGHILFRFTIGSTREEDLAYWEPGAPPFPERLAALRLAHERGFATSVSAEPLLGDAWALYDAVGPYISDSIWFGKLNRIRSRVAIETPEDQRRIVEIESRQTDDKIRELYERMKDRPFVRWKESIKIVVGLAIATQPGLDL